MYILINHDYQKKKKKENKIFYFYDKLATMYTIYVISYHIDIVDIILTAKSKLYICIYEIFINP